jgi:hypothetical protein
VATAGALAAGVDLTGAVGTERGAEGFALSLDDAGQRNGVGDLDRLRGGWWGRRCCGLDGLILGLTGSLTRRLRRWVPGRAGGSGEAVQRVEVILAVLAAGSEMGGDARVCLGGDLGAVLARTQGVLAEQAGVDGVIGSEGDEVQE